MKVVISTAPEVLFVFPVTVEHQNLAAVQSAKCESLVYQCCSVISVISACVTVNRCTFGLHQIFLERLLTTQI